MLGNERDCEQRSMILTTPVWIGLWRSIPLGLSIFMIFLPCWGNGNSLYLLNHVPFVFKVGSDYGCVYLDCCLVLLFVQHVIFRASSEWRSKGALGNYCGGHGDVMPKVTEWKCDLFGCIIISNEIHIIIRTGKNDGAADRRWLGGRNHD